MANNDPCVATRVDADTILLQCRAEGPDGLVGDLSVEVRRGDPGWAEAFARLPPALTVRKSPHHASEEISFSQLARYRDAHLKGQIFSKTWQPIEKVYPAT